jgi:hypothetical protein
MLSSLRTKLAEVDGKILHEFRLQRNKKLAIYRQFREKTNSLVFFIIKIEPVKALIRILPR